MNKKVLILFATVLSLNSIYAQDKLYRINPKKVIDCKVIEIGEDLIKYSSSQYGNSLTFTVDKNNVELIEFENGKEVSFSNSMFGAEHYESQRKHALKLSFLTPAQGYTEIGYEYSLKPGQSVDFGIALIGAGWDIENRKPGGIGLRAGYKFMTSPTYYERRQRYSHILKGAYVKPELSFVHYTSQYEMYTYNDFNYYSPSSQLHRTAATLGAIHIIGGKQWVFSDRFLIDIYGGIGYGFGSYNKLDNEYVNPNHFLFTGAVNGFPLTFTCGFRIGLLI